MTLFKILFKLFVLVTILIFSACSKRQIHGNLSADSFLEKIKKDSSIYLIDVRTPKEYTKGHLASAKNINWKGTDFDEQISTLNKNKTVMVYCMKGKRSTAAAEYLRAQGFKEVYQLDGGFKQWREAGLPETTDPFK
jgi:thioredoxin 1